jgi:hypothetical protein
MPRNRKNLFKALSVSSGASRKLEGPFYLNNLHMKHVRIDSSGMNYKDERIKTLSNFIKQSNLIDENKIDILIDHKGNLEVHWNQMPLSYEKLSINALWEYLNEYTVYHYLVTKSIEEI